MRRDPGAVLEDLLVASAMSGSRAAFAHLVTRWSPRLIQHARRLLHDQDAARDAVQDAWISAAQGLRGLDDPSRFPAWMFALVSRRCVDTVRRAIRNRRLLAEVAQSVEGASSDPTDERLDLRNAIARLPVDQRLVVSLHYGEGLGVEEIAAGHGIPLGTVKSRLFAAREALKKHFEGDDHGDYR